MQKVNRFFRENQFALMVATAWLLTIWAIVLLAQATWHLPLSLASWGGSWDGAWYRQIVEHGYATNQPNYQVNLAFFPLLPLLTWLVKTVLFLPTVWAGMLISTLSFGGALILLYQLAAKQFGQGAARWTILLLAFNPFSFYFAMMYTESLFLLLAVATFWFVGQKRWWLAAFTAGFSTATRSVGIALAIVVVVAWIMVTLKPAGWLARIASSFPEGAAQAFARARLAIRASRAAGFNSRGRTPILLQTCGIVLLSFSGILLFSYYLQRHTGDPFAYKTVQSYWPGRGGLPNLFKETAWLFHPPHINKEFALRLMWSISALVGLVGLGLLIKMQQRAMSTFAAIALLLPLWFGTFGSMNRYVQVVFPVFIAYAILLRRTPRWLRLGVLVLGYLSLCGMLVMMVDPAQIFIG